MRSQGETPSGRILGASENRLAVGFDGDSTADARQNLAAMKRRRNAALRCEPLASGSRDPQFGWGC